MSDINPMPAPPTPPGKPDGFEERRWITLGLFLLTALVLIEIYLQPALQDDKLFFALSVSIVSGSFGGAMGYYYGSSKTNNKDNGNGTPPNG